MRRRKNRLSYYEEKESKRLFTIAVVIVSIAIITFIITYIIYSNAIKKTKVGSINKITNTSIYNNEEISETGSAISKSVNEVLESNNNTINNEENIKTEKIAINTSNIIKKDNEDNNTKENVKETSNNIEENKKEKIPDPTFIKPVEGEILREYAIESLVYSDTLKEWVTHTGIDIKADRKTIVKASADGIVKSIKNDPRYGLTVVMEHANGFKSVYSNLLTAEFVKVNEEIKQGQTIGTVGDNAPFEVLDESHLHFEILKDDEYMNPCEFIK